MQPEKYASNWWTRPGVVYFIGAGRPVTAVKIGVTQLAKIKQRLRAIQCDNHEPVELLGVIVFKDGPRPLLDAERQEQKLHTQFARHQRIVDGNVGHEWFGAADDLLDYIKQYALPPEDIQAPRSVAVIAVKSESASTA